MSEQPEIRLAATYEGPNATEADRARVTEISRPLAETLISQPPQDRWNVMGTLLMTYAMSFPDPINAFENLVAEVRRQLPAMVAQVKQSRGEV